LKLLDTNIVLYAAGRSHRYKGPCSELLERVVAGDVDCSVDAELFQEILYVYTARGERRRGFQIFDDLCQIFSTPFAIAREEITVARELLERYPALSPRDAIHAAVVITQELEGIVTTDSAFASIQELTAFDPIEIISQT